MAILRKGQLLAGVSSDEISFTRRRNAKRYIASLDSQGRIRVTIPRGGTQREANDFVRENLDWLREQQRIFREKAANSRLAAGDLIWFRGEQVELRVSKDWGRPVLQFADHAIFIADEAVDLSRPLSSHFRSLAKCEFPKRAADLAERFKVEYSRISIRDQRTRWGSCSTSGVISLNWRLIMAPQNVADYVIIHELMHLRDMSHSPRFWKLVEAACPDFRERESWLESRQPELSWG